jgi:hypothetical protein
MVPAASLNRAQMAADQARWRHWHAARTPATGTGHVDGYVTHGPFWLEVFFVVEAG